MAWCLRYVRYAGSINDRGGYKFLAFGLTMDALFASYGSSKSDACRTASDHSLNDLDSVPVSPREGRAGWRYLLETHFPIALISIIFGSWAASVGGLRWCSVLAVCLTAALVGKSFFHLIWVFLIRIQEGFTSSVELDITGPFGGILGQKF